MATSFGLTFSIHPHIFDFSLILFYSIHNKSFFRFIQSIFSKGPIFVKLSWQIPIYCIHLLKFNYFKATQSLLKITPAQLSFFDSILLFNYTDSVIDHIYDNCFLGYSRSLFEKFPSSITFYMYIILIIIISIYL